MQAGDNNARSTSGDDRPGYELYESIDRFVRRRVRNAADAADIVQEVFLRLASQEPPITVEKVRAWLYRTARNRIVDFWRSRRKVHVGTDAMENIPALPLPSIVEREEENQMMLDLLGELDEKHQEVLRLKFQEGLSYDEIAKVIDRPKTTVGWLLHESLILLRDKLAVSPRKENR